MAQESSGTMKVWTGRHVVLELLYEDGERERLSLDIVADSAADFSSGFLGEGTPLAKAILGQTVGSVIPYQAGDVLQVHILEVSGELSGTPEDLSDRREETLRKAVRAADRTSTMIYASSMGNKWGDMDPGALDETPAGDDKENK